MFKTLRPNEVQKNEAKASGLGKDIFNGIITAMLIYYVKTFGIDLYSGEYLHSIIPAFGALTKASELSNVFRNAVDGVNHAIH
jgi:hypothetical protein